MLWSIAFLRLSFAYLRVNDVVVFATPYLAGVIATFLPVAIVCRVVYGSQDISAPEPEPVARFAPLTRYVAARPSFGEHRYASTIDSNGFPKGLVKVIERPAELVNIEKGPDSGDVRRSAKLDNQFFQEASLAGNYPNCHPATSDNRTLVDTSSFVCESPHSNRPFDSVIPPRIFLRSSIQGRVE